MLAAKFFLENKDVVLQGLLKRGYPDPGYIFIALEKGQQQLKVAKTHFETMKAMLNHHNKEIGVLKQSGKDKEAEEIKVKALQLKESIKSYEDTYVDEEALLKKILIGIPNIPHISVPNGKTPADNAVVKEAGTKPVLATTAQPHWELIKKYDLVDFETGAKITGSGFPLYKGRGAKLQRALIQYFLDYNTAAGYTEYLPPLLVNEATAYGTGQLPDKEGQMYHATEDNFYLIPTAEVPVTNIYRDEIVKENDLPIKMTAYTPCFRREAGSFGSDVRGLNRVHQFDKVEIIQLVHPDKSYAVLEEMVLHVEQLLQSLQLPYRILLLCGGDMGFTSAKTYDFEVYSAAQQKWLEVSSVSNFESFQSNRMKIRFKDEGNKTQLVHTLNGSSLALPRIMACLLENNQTAEGINLPKVLHQYFGATTIQ